MIGATSILATGKNQRLGDLAAGTLVVRDRPAKAVAHSEAAAAPVESAAWDTSAITAEEVAAVRRFLERRHEIEAGARAELARTFATRLWPKVAGAREGLDAERFLTLLVAAKATRGSSTR